MDALKRTICTAIQDDTIETHFAEQIDPVLMKEVGEELANRYADEIITKVITFKGASVAPATFLALTIGAPVVFTCDLLTEDDNVLIVDTMLGDGEVVKELADSVQQLGAYLVGVGIVVEQHAATGGALLREHNIRVEALAVV